MDAADSIGGTDEGKEETLNKFYQVATYCKINYLKKYTEIEGLYRVRVKKA